MDIHLTPPGNLMNSPGGAWPCSGGVVGGREKDSPLSRLCLFGDITTKQVRLVKFGNFRKTSGF